MNATFRSLLATGLLLALGWAAYAVLLAPDTYTGRGRVSGISGDSTITIAHERIPGYMPPMIMPFPVRDSALLAGVSSGDAVEFRLSVSDEHGRITALTRLPDTAVARNPAQTVTPMDSSTDAETSSLREGDVLPQNVSLITQAGDSLHLGDYRGQMLVLTFIYTRCPLPNYCPEMSRHFAALQPRLREQYGSDVQLLSISFDPAYDTPAVLRDYAARYTDRLDTWTFATGDTSSVRRATRLFGVHTQPGNADKGELLHNLTTAVIGPDGTVHRLFRGSDWTPEDVRQAVERAR
jgi:protein SCO1/2